MCVADEVGSQLCDPGMIKNNIYCMLLVKQEVKMSQRLQAI